MLKWVPWTRPDLRLVDPKPPTPDKGCESPAGLGGQSIGDLVADGQRGSLATMDIEKCWADHVAYIRARTQFVIYDPDIVSENDAKRVVEAKAGEFIRVKNCARIVLFCAGEAATTWQACRGETFTKD